MATHVCKKFVWVIKNFPSLKSKKCIYSDSVLIGDYKWRLRAYPNGNKVVDQFSLYLEVADLESLPSGWRRYVKFCLTTVVPHDAFAGKYELEIEEGRHLFDKVSPSWGYSYPLTKLEKDVGYVVNGELIIYAEVDVFEAIGTLDTSEKSKESSRPLKKTKLNDDCAEKKKEKEQSDLAKLAETEVNILKLKEKLSELEALVEEKKAELLATRTTLIIR